jgi:hypothetical protein
MTKNRKNKQVTASEETKVLLYTTADQQHRLEVFLEDDTAWLSQRQLADLYQVGTNTINYHISQIFKDRELEKEATIRNYRIVQSEANREVTRSVEFYNLEMILAIGYRVRSSRGVEFRQWATEHLKEFVVKGFTLDDERLKGNSSLVDYFDELLARIRDIRASEKRVYLRVREIFFTGSGLRPQKRGCASILCHHAKQDALCRHWQNRGRDSRRAVRCKQSQYGTH